jgi:hypothetical protein
MNEMNNTAKTVADKPKRKRASKSKQIRRLLAKGLTPKEIAAKVGVNVNHVYHVRWYDNNKAGIASLRKHKVTQTLGTDQIPYVSPVAEAHTPSSPTYVFAPRVIHTPIAPTFWQRVRSLFGR